MPGTRCAVAVCNNSLTKTKNDPAKKHIQYHIFPKDKELKRVWAQRCRRTGKWKPDTCRICSEHFAQDAYERDLKAELLKIPCRKRILKAGAVPTLNLGAKEPSGVAQQSSQERAERLARRTRKKEVEKILEDANRRFGDSNNTQHHCELSVTFCVNNTVASCPEPVQEISHLGPSPATLGNSSASEAACVDANPGPVFETSHTLANDEIPKSCSESTRTPIVVHLRRDPHPKHVNENAHPSTDTPMNSDQSATSSHASSVEGIPGENGEIETLKQKIELLTSQLKHSQQAAESLLSKLKRTENVLNCQVLKNLSLKRELKCLKHKHASQSKMFAHLQSKLKTIFTQPQVSALLSSKSRVQWDEEGVAAAFALQHLSKQAYLYLKNTLKYPLSQLSSLQKLTAAADKAPINPSDHLYFMEENDI